jgi:RNA polymerase sigma factor (sigma-70 family)
MLKVKAGKLDHMGLLFERYHKPLFGFLYHSTGQMAQSEDMVQTVFYRMLKYRHTFGGDGEFRTWMFHVARNVVNDAFKKNQRTVYKSDLTTLVDAVAETPDVETRIETEHQNEELYQALQMLNYEHREVLILSRFQELSYKEIAEILKTTEGNIKVKVHRAMKELKDIYLKIRK